MASAESGTGKQAEAFKALDIAITDSNGQLRDSDEVWNEVIQELSLVENETEREALAMDLLGKSAGDLNPLLEDGGEAYQNLAEAMQKYGLDFIDQDMLDRANEFNDSLDTIKAIGMVAFQQLGTQLAAYLAPVMERVVDLVGRLANWFSELSPRTQAIIAGIAGVVAIAAPLLLGLGQVAFAISSIISLMAVVGPAIAGIVAALGPVVLIIGAVVAAGILLYKNWDTIKAKAVELWTNVTTIWQSITDSIRATIAQLVSNTVGKFNSLKTTVETVWNGIKSAMINPIQTARDTLQGIIDKVKSWFPINLGNIFNF
jgi:phage-related minor tail protein